MLLKATEIGVTVFCYCSLVFVGKNLNLLMESIQTLTCHFLTLFMFGGLPYLNVKYFHIVSLFLTVTGHYQ